MAVGDAHEILEARHRHVVLGEAPPWLDDLDDQVAEARADPLRRVSPAQAEQEEDADRQGAGQRRQPDDRREPACRLHLQLDAQHRDGPGDALRGRRAVLGALQRRVGAVRRGQRQLVAVEGERERRREHLLHGDAADGTVQLHGGPDGDRVGVGHLAGDGFQAVGELAQVAETEDAVDAGGVAREGLGRGETEGARPAAAVRHHDDQAGRAEGRVWQLRLELPVEAQVERADDLDVGGLARAEDAVLVDGPGRHLGAVRERPGLRVLGRAGAELRGRAREGDEGEHATGEGNQAEHACDGLGGLPGDEAPLPGAATAGDGGTAALGREPGARRCCRLAPAPLALGLDTTAEQREQRDDAGDDRRVGGLAQPARPVPDATDLEPEAAEDLAARRLVRVDEGVVVALQHEAFAVEADDAVQHVALEIAVHVEDDIANARRRRGAHHDQVALVELRLHRGAVGEAVDGAAADRGRGERHVAGGNDRERGKQPDDAQRAATRLHRRFSLFTQSACVIVSVSV